MSKIVKYNIIFTITLLVITLFSSNAFSIDPMYIGVGARALGMGKAYVGVAEDADTIFMNPAGLGSIDQIKASSMYTKLFDDVTYMVGGVAYPIDGELGVIGGGLISSVTDGIDVYDGTGALLGVTTYKSNVMFVSYGLDLGRMKSYGNIAEQFKGVSVGASLKIFSVGSDYTSDLNGSGYSIDLGVLYKYAPYMQLGATLQNGLSTGINYDSTGVRDEIPSLLKVGTKINIVGGSNAYYTGDYTLDGAFDMDISVNEKVPSILHMGLEYKPMDILYLRGGIDQVPAPEGPQNNMTLGIGLDYEGVQFNYAYHPYSDMPGAATHFFSICYVGPEKAPAPKVESTEPIIVLTAPADKTITRDHIIKVEGTIRADAGVKEVFVDDTAVQVVNNKFETVAPLSIGKNLIEVRATSIAPEVKTETATARILRTIRFSDVQQDFWAAQQIESCATVGLVSGYPDGTFKPERILSRAELSTLLVKAKGRAPEQPKKTLFKDMPKLHWATPYVAGAMGLGLVKGYPDGSFKPNKDINRAEGVMVLGRFDELKEPEVIETGPYADLNAKFWASKMITAAKSEGLLEYLGENDFLPTRGLTRAEAVEIISKTKVGKSKIDELHDWTVGFVPGGSAQVALKSFNDINESYWAVKPVQYLATVGIIGGYPDGTFKPEKALTRAELCTLLVKAKGIASPTVVTTGFNDLSAKHWAAPYVKAAVDMGLVTGYPDGKFKPEKKLNRAETVAIIARFDKLDTTKEMKYGPFPDMTAKHWSAKYIEAAKEAGILEYLKGQDFQPDRALTRAEAAEMIARTNFGMMKIKEVFGKNADLGATKAVNEPASPAAGTPQ